MKRIFIIIIIIFLIGVFYFFFPKYAGGNCGECDSPPSIQRIVYGCFGIQSEFRPPKGCMDCGTTIKCFGIVTSNKKCFTYIQKGYVEVPDCKNSENWQEVLDICPNCYYQAASFAVYDGDLKKGIEICKLDNTGLCFLSIATIVSGSMNISNVNLICNNTMSENNKEQCMDILNGVIYKIIEERLQESDIDGAVNTCLTENIKDKDSCLYNIAMQLRDKNVTKALEICNMIEKPSLGPSCEQEIKIFSKV